RCRRFLDARVPGQVQIIIGAEHQDLALAQSDFAGAAALASAESLKIDVKTGLLQGPCAIKFPAFFEDVPALGSRAARWGDRSIVHGIQLLTCCAATLTRRLIDAEAGQFAIVRTPFRNMR